MAHLMQNLHSKTSGIEFVHSHVWGELKEVNPFVEFHVFLVVDVQLFVRIDRHQQRADVRLHPSGQTIAFTCNVLER